MSGTVDANLRDELNRALAVAEKSFAAGIPPTLQLSPRLSAALNKLHEKASVASTAFTAIITSLAIKSAYPSVDIRYHQTQTQHKTDRPAGFAFRQPSQNAVYPWLSVQTFQTAKSGWQTRTVERPKPYTLDYDENIKSVKQPFLEVFDEIEVHHQDAFSALTYLIWRQVVRREDVRITLSVPKMQNIAAITELFRRHFFRRYKGVKGASRLPVLALYAIYAAMIPELKRYQGRSLKPLNEHSAADSQTGSLGDIEVADDHSGEIFEAIEVKHNLPITEAIAADVQSKVMDKAIERYYVLTTHANCSPDEGALKIIENVRAVYNCQVIANGVMPTIRYYLRLLDDPSAVFPGYVALLQTDKSIAHEHRTAWNEVVKSTG